jgi:hypothetical protein
MRSVESANHLDIKAGKGVGMTQQRQPVGMLREPLGE